MISKLFSPKTSFDILRQKYDAKEESDRLALQAQLEEDLTTRLAKIARLKLELISAYDNDDHNSITSLRARIKHTELFGADNAAMLKMVSDAETNRVKSKKIFLEQHKKICDELLEQPQPINLSIERAKRAYEARLEAKETEYDNWFENLSYEGMVAEINSKYSAESKSFFTPEQETKFNLSDI